MAPIEIHMFEVQLGAALLLELEDSTGQAVTILADGGIHAAGYTQDHVAVNLGGILAGAKAIDLMIGTHYDKDHLAGLIDVADQFTVREAILPPIRKPRHGQGAGTVAAQSAATDLDDAGDLPLLVDLSDEEFDLHIDGLKTIAEAADRELRRGGFQVDEDMDPDERIFNPEEEFDLDTPALPLMQAPPGLASAQLNRIRASAHKGAIVATWLKRLVKKLRSKHVPIRAIDIPAGHPEYYAWDCALTRFVKVPASTYNSSSEPKFTLLGPSRQLIAHHAKKLPIGTYLALHQRIPLKPVTASNQLSYVMLFELAGQKILVTGDAGCVDFWDKKGGRYHPALIAALQDLHVAQVAHHAGNNHRFYEVLEKIGFPSPAIAAAFLLLSHADHDALRPTPAFATFISKILATSGTFELLTTSKPDPAKVTAYRAHYHAPTHFPARSIGDVQLRYQHGKWQVNQHLVQA